MKKLFFTLLPVVLFYTANSQAAWNIKYETQKVFIENKGQFDNLNNLPGSEVLFATQSYANQVLFTKSGLTYRFEERIHPSKEVREEREKKFKEKYGKGEITHRQLEEEENRMTIRRDFVQMEWVNPNPDVEVTAVEEVSHYYNYGELSYVKAFKKITYRGLYPGIDVVYEFHPENGIEYSFILHPGADASQIRMKYSDVAAINNGANGSLLYPTRFGNIIEHAPHTFYLGNANAAIESRFVKAGKEVSFYLGNYDKNKEVVIDPWIQTPSFASQWDCVWEVEKDGSGNAYLIGGVTPMQLLKYNSAGALLWTYSTPYDTTSWLGTFAVDNAGNSYVTQGSLAAIQKVSTNGTLVWNNGNPGGIFSSTEFWSISFNCDQTKLVIGGTGGFLPPLPYIYQVDMNSGNVTSSVQITGGALFPTQEVRSITACGNGKYYFLTHDSIGYINQNFSICSNSSDAVHYTSNGYALGYKCENFRYNNTGIEAIKTYGAFAYVNRGNRLDKRDFATGAIISSVTIPGGAFSTSFGSSFNENSGIDIDACGNIYVGSRGQVIKYDQNLTQLAVYNTSSSYNVYDVEVSTGGNIIVGGSNGTANSGARQGYIESIAAGACSIIAITCCDASICEAGPFCTTSGPIALTPSTSGGTWSGTGVNPTTGVFSPSVAGQGTHYIRNTIGCGSDSIAIRVNICAALNACLEQNGNITASGGTGPYAWSEQDTTQNCSSCVLGCIFPPGCAVTSYVWSQFATGATVSPPEFPLRVRDINDNELIITSTNSLQACAACALTASASSTSATCGSNNGSATVAANGGTPTAYLWSNGATTATASNLTAGAYTVTVTASGCTATASVTVNATGAVNTSTSSTNAGCGLSNGSATVTPTGGNGTFTYLWSNGSNTATISNVASGSYTVTVSSNGCTATASVSVNAPNTVTASTSSVNAGCNLSNGSATVTAGGGNGAYTYQWSNGGNTATISNVSSGTYNVTVTSNGCTATSTVQVNTTSNVTSSASATNAGCVNDGSANVQPGGGNGTYTYLWNNGATTAGISNLSPGTYTVTVTSAGCTATASAVVAATGSVSTTVSSTDAGCNVTGSAVVTPTGGIGSFTYLWSNGSTTGSISNLSGGTYDVTVTSGNCTATASAVVNSVGGVSLSPASTNTSCGSSNGTASVTPTSGVSPFTYLWTGGQTTSTITGLAAGTYSVTVTDANTCSATLSVVVSPSSINPATITTNKTIMCSGDSAYICVTGSYTSYLWNTGQTGQCIYTKLAGNYYVTVTDINNCTVASNRVTISVYPLPPVSVTVNGDTLTAYNAVTYQWYLNSVPIPNATSNVYIAAQPGNYTVEVTDSNGCRALSTKITITTTDIAEVLDNGIVRVYPNPLEKGYWNIEVDNSRIGSSVEIFDADGRLVYRTQIRNLVTEIDLEASSGIYLLKIVSETSSITRKLIKL